MKKIYLGIVDDHQIVIDGLVSLLQAKKEFHIQFVTTDPTSVVDLIGKNHIDVLLTDVMMPILPGNKLAKAVKLAFPNVHILALSMSGEGKVVDEMIRDSDIMGYALKNISYKELCIAIEKVSEGGIYFSPEVLDDLGRIDVLEKENMQVHLTTREMEILKLIEKEMGNKEIAKLLFISELTVETHRKNIFRKTKTNSLIGLIKYAYQHNLIS